METIMILDRNRPKDFYGEGDEYLNDLFMKLQLTFQNAQESLNYSTLRLPPKKLKIMIAALVEFAEDLHNDIGIWKSYERYNNDFFGKSLPLTPESDEDGNKKSINNSRVHHFLWGIYSLLISDLILSPTHHDLFHLASDITKLLQEEIQYIPKSSGVKDFLFQRDVYGWDIKKKLIWLGKHSYLFRLCFHNYIKEKNVKKEKEIQLTDDFICQETTI